jgi:hypothetical protein
MPIHDWTRVDASLFHAFRHRWLAALCDALNAGGLPEDHVALVEAARGGDRIAVGHHRGGRRVAVVEIISPGDKAGDGAVRGLVEATAGLIVGRVHVLIVDLFPPGRHDPRGVHAAIWDELEEEGFEPPADRPLLVAAYDSGPLPVTYVEPIAVGDVLPEMPLFLEPGSYVPTPLESSYQEAWDRFPVALKDLLGREGRPAAHPAGPM